MQPKRTYSKVGARKKKRSTRNKLHKRQSNYKKKSDLRVLYSYKTTRDGEEVTLTSYTDWPSSGSYSDHGNFYLTQDTRQKVKFWMPSNMPNWKDFGPPIKWRFAKAFYRSDYKVRGLKPTVNYMYHYGLETDDFVITGNLFPTSGLVYQMSRSRLEYNNHYLEFNQKLGDQKVDVLTTLAEAKSTVTMVANAAQDVLQLYRAVKKADTKRVKRLLGRRGIERKIKRGWRNKTAENRWLELQYGWQPMVSDIRLALEEFTEGKRNGAPIMKVQHSTVFPVPEKFEGPEWPAYDHFAVLKTVCYYTVQSKEAREKAQWNLANNLLLTGWELIPYSFVVDWLMPVGDFIQQFSAEDGLEFIDGSTVEYVKFDGIHTKDTYKNGFGSIKLRSFHSYFHVDRITHNRTPIGYPAFSPGLSAKRLLNGLALLSQRR